MYICAVDSVVAVSQKGRTGGGDERGVRCGGCERMGWGTGGWYMNGNREMLTVRGRGLQSVILIISIESARFSF